MDKKEKKDREKYKKYFYAHILAPLEYAIGWHYVLWVTEQVE